MFTQKFIKMFHSVQEIGLFSLWIWIWTSATPPPIPNDIWQSPGLHLVNINAYAKFDQFIPNGLRVIDIFRHFSRTGRRQNHLFRIWTSATPRPIPNDIWQSLGLHPVNINAYAKFYQNIPDSLRDRAIFTLNLNLNLGNASANPKWHLTISWATSCQYQCVCKIWSIYSKRFKSYRHFSTFFTNRPASKSSQMFDYRALLEIQLSFDFLRVVQLNYALF